FEKQIKFLDNHPEYAVVSCPMIYFDETGDWGKGKSNPTPDKNSFKNGTPHAHAPSMMRTAVLKEVQGYTVDKRLVRGQDYYLWYKIYKAGYKGFNLQEHLYKMRDDKGAMGRRTVLSRIYNFMIQRQVLNDLEIRYASLYAFKELVKIFVPKPLMVIFRKKRLKNNI